MNTEDFKVGDKIHHKSYGICTVDSITWERPFGFIATRRYIALKTKSGSKFKISGQYFDELKQAA